HDLDVVGRETGAGAQPCVRHGAVLVEPPVGERAVVAHPVRVLPAEERHLRNRCALHTGGDVAELRRQPAGPYVAGLDDVIVGRDDARDLGRGHGCRTSRRYRTSQSFRCTTSSRGLRRGLPSCSAPTPRNTPASRNIRGGTPNSSRTRPSASPKNVVNSEETPSACAASIMF